MQKLFLKWREQILNVPQYIGDNISKNGHYNINFDFVPSRKRYVDNAGLIVYDTILDDKYTSGTAENPRKDKLMAIVEFDETIVTAEELAFDLENCINRVHSTKVLTTIEAKEFLDNFTTCTKTDNLDGTFTYTIREERTLEGVTTPAYFVTL